MSLCVFFLLPSLFRLSAVSVVFDFNDSLNDVAPESPILLPVDVKKKEKSDLLMDVFVCLLLSSPHRLSAVSVVFDFNDSLNDIVPLSPILFPVDEKRNEKSNLFMNVSCVIFCIDPVDQV